MKEHKSVCRYVNTTARRLGSWGLRFAQWCGSRVEVTGQPGAVNTTGVTFAFLHCRLRFCGVKRGEKSSYAGETLNACVYTYVRYIRSIRKKAHWF